MGTSTSKKSTKKEEIEEKIVEEQEPKGKSQKVKILVLTFRFGDKIVSALGISSPTSSVEHRLPKSKLKPDEMFNIASALTNDKYYANNKRWAGIAQQALSEGLDEIVFPPEPANEFSKKPIGKLIHEILNIEIELFIK
jgi:hypothetical protein